MSSPIVNPLMQAAQSPQMVTNPGQLAQAMGGGVPQGPMPQTSPVQQSNGGMTPDVIQLMTQIAQKYQMPAMQNIGNTAGQISQVADSMNQPIPKYGPQIEHGAGFLHNLGQALIMASGTGNMIYGPKVQQYEAGQKQKAARIDALKGASGAYGQEAQTAAEAESGLGLANYRQGMLGVQNDRNQIRQQLADTAQQNANTAVGRLDMNKLLVGDKQELMKARTALAGVQTALAPQKLQMEQYGIDQNNMTREAVANAMISAGYPKEFTTSAIFDNLLGTNFVPPAPQIPNAPSPRTPAKTQSKAKSAAQHTPGGAAQGLKEGQTGKGSDGNNYVVKGGVWIPAP